MQIFRRGIGLGFLFFAIHFLCNLLSETVPELIVFILAIVAYVYTLVKMLTYAGPGELFASGVIGFASMFFFEIFSWGFYDNELSDVWFNLYLTGFYSAVAGVVISVLVCLNRRKNDAENEKIQSNFTEVIMEKDKKINLSIYLIISIVSCAYLVIPEFSGMGVLIFTLLQAVMLFFIMPDRKRLIWFLPIIIFGINSFISSNTMWRMPNIIVSIAVIAIMYHGFDMSDTSVTSFIHIGQRIVAPPKFFSIPLKWIFEANGNTRVIKRVLIAIIISIPCVVILLAVLSSADMIFGTGIENFIEQIANSFHDNLILKCIVSITCGFYLFGAVYAGHMKFTGKTWSFPEKRIDTLILNIVLSSILLVYTIFIIVQFKYLFTDGELPYDLSYTEYARKGFFELLALTAVNVILIIFAVNFTKTVKNRFTTILCCYLCVVTIVLLVSSFYRMQLYNADDGLTRLRFMVFGFLIFEALGLIFTFIYILKPKFNITAVYLCIALFYYTVLNLVPIDYFVAKSQVDRYFSGDNAGIDYTLTLSYDAAPQIERLYGTEYDAEAKQWIYDREEYFKQIPARWQRINYRLNI